jgi:hypothetical protein
LKSPYKAVLTTTIYHAKSGSEDALVKFWNTKFRTLAKVYGADEAHIYYNEENDEYVAYMHWPAKGLAINFLNSKEFIDVNKNLNNFCLIPSNKIHFEILNEEAA